MDRKVYMKNLHVSFIRYVMLTCFLASGLVAAQMDNRSFGHPIQSAPVDPQIQGAIQTISPQRIQQDISTLVGFHNRSTLSSSDKDLPRGQGVLGAPDWQFYHSVGMVTQAIIPVSKDNVIFGVRAVNRAGQWSSATFPFPARFRTPPIPLPKQ